MCKKNGESVDHLVIHCEVATRLWHYMFTLFGIEWVMPQKVLDLFACWNHEGGRDLAKAIWRMAPLCLLMHMEGEECETFFRIRNARWMGWGRI
jgi:hypothetical protein